MQDTSIKKLYYSIGEVSDLTGLETHVLRYWESEFDQLHPRKNRAGRRIYTKEDIAVVQRIQHLLRVDKYTIEGARQVMNRAEVENGEPKAGELFMLRIFLEKLLQKL